MRYRIRTGLMARLNGRLRQASFSRSEGRNWTAGLLALVSAVDFFLPAYVRATGAVVQHERGRSDADIDPRAIAREREGEVIMIFGDGIPGKSLMEVSNSMRDEVAQAIADSEDAESAIERAGGRIQFRYRAALIGFSALLPPGETWHPNYLSRQLGLRESRSRKPLTVKNWDVLMLIAPAPDAFDILLSAPAFPGPPQGLDRIGQRLLNLNGKFFPPSLPNEVHAYVIDSGVRASHSDFKIGTIVNVLDGYEGFSGVSNSACLRHGSRVAGILGGRTHGVAPGAKIHSVRVINCVGDVELARAIKGVDWVTDHYVAAGGSFPAVANMSLTFDMRQRNDEWLATLAIFETAVRNSVQAGITYVAAAGNSAIDVKHISPARMPEVIAVASTDPRTDEKAPTSNVGARVDIFAPGVDIRSVGSRNDDDWSMDSATSFAAPHVAGVALVVRSRTPGLDPPHVRMHILDAANDDDDMGTWCGVEGRGSAPNVLLHWGGSGDGVTDSEPAPASPQPCN